MASHEKAVEKSPVEIERKFLISSLPTNLHEFPHEKITQGYLVKGIDGSEVRLRRRGDDYSVTVKTKGDISRGEWETFITPAQFEALWPATEGQRVEKTRYTIPYGDLQIELDIYSGHLSGLMTAEVEFIDESGAFQFTVPEWFGREVTFDKSYKNQELATRIPSLM